MLACNPPTVEAPKYGSYGTCAATYGGAVYGAPVYGGSVNGGPVGGSSINGAPVYGAPTPAVIESDAAAPATDGAVDVPTPTP
jgi:hypothetical protein